jgi:hypothetical protein
MSDIEQSLSPLTDSVPRLEAQAILRMGHNKLYEQLRLGNLDAVKDGPRTYITVESIRRYQASRPKATFLPPAVRQNNFHTIKHQRTTETATCQKRRTPNGKHRASAEDLDAAIRRAANAIDDPYRCHMRKVRRAKSRLGGARTGPGCVQV